MFMPSRPPLTTPHVLMVYREGDEDNRHLFEAEYRLVQDHTTAYAYKWDPSRTDDTNLKILKDQLLTFNPNVIHFYSVFPLIPSSVYFTVQSLQIPIIQALNTYQSLCANGLLWRADQVCEACVGKPLAWPGVYYGCHQTHLIASTLKVVKDSFHKMLGLWDTVDRFMVPTSFMRQLYIQEGVLPETLVVKPPFLDPDPGFSPEGGPDFLYVGELSVRQGVQILLKAWEILQGQGTLKLVGDGPLKSNVEIATTQMKGLEYLGSGSRVEVLDLLSQSRALIVPSLGYGRQDALLLDAYAVGTPVVASQVGPLADWVREGQTGLMFTPGSPQSLADTLAWICSHPQEWQLLRHYVRQEFMTFYTPEQNYSQLLEIYTQVIKL